MITPYSNSFYSVQMSGPTAIRAIGSFIDVGGDIENVFITSLDFESDLHAFVECQKSIERIAATTETSFNPVISFNPLYLPTGQDLFEIIEFNDVGEISKVGEFNNPFITASIKLSTADAEDFLSANVCFKQFELPTARSLLTLKKVPLS